MVHSSYLDIYHHGIKGQKWGIRRTPAQLGHAVSSGVKKAASSIKTASANRKKKKQDEEQKKKDEDLQTRKDRIIKSRSAKQLYENADLFTTQELQTAYNRLNLERNIANLAASEKSAGRRFVDGAINSTRKVGDLIQATNKVVGGAQAFGKLVSPKDDDKNKNNKNQGNESKKKDDTPTSNYKPKHMKGSSKVSDVQSGVYAEARNVGREFLSDIMEDLGDYNQWQERQQRKKKK